MTRWLIRAALAAAAAPAAAQVPPAELGARYIAAPWWLREPVIASMGMVRTEVPANRASFGASFREVARDAAEAQRKASARVQALDAALRALGADRVRLTTTFSTRTIYQQYRDKEGILQENERADRIEGYEVSADLAIDVRDVRALEEAYGRVLGARPTEVDNVEFRLEPDNALKTWLATEALKDAARRARDGAAAAGARLGGAKVIDPSGGVCKTEVLVRWPSSVAGVRSTDIDSSEIVVTAQRAPAPPPPPAPAVAGHAAAPVVRVTLQPPREALTEEACVIYALLP